MGDLADGIALGRELERTDRAISELREGEWAEAAAVAELAEQIAANRVAIEALSSPAADEVIDEVTEESAEESAEETVEEIIGEIVEDGEEPEGEIEAAVAEETAEIMEDVAESVDEITPTREHPLTRRVFG